MGMFDSFFTTEKKGSSRCPNGHKVRDDWQTKKFECILADYHLGDIVDPEFIEAKVWVYNTCVQCDRICGRYIIIKDARYVDFTDVEWEDDIDRHNAVLEVTRGPKPDGI